VTRDLRREAADLLARLIACDTSNPPGRETAAARLLSEYLTAAGVECELVARDPERANLVARLRGGSGPSLMFLGHLDVVPADQRGWSVPPFSGTERDGAIWGRGAVDMKSQVAAAAVALAELARSGERPQGDVLLVGAADEEVGDAEVGGHPGSSRSGRTSAPTSPSAKGRASGSPSPAAPSTSSTAA
jgi:acetylornithine deacetylase/succinyl-diaminopimelate desuccinylase-like protein